MTDRGNSRRQRRQPAWRKHQWVAAGHHHFPDFWALYDIGERCFKRGIRQMRRLTWSDTFAAKTEAAIDRANGCKLQEHAVGVTVHKSWPHLMHVVADRIIARLRQPIQFGAAWNELPGDRISGIGGVDQLSHGRAD